MYTPKDLKNEGQHIFFKLLSFVIYTNLLYVVLLFLTVSICKNNWGIQFCRKHNKSAGYQIFYYIK